MSKIVINNIYLMNYINTFVLGKVEKKYEPFYIYKNLEKFYYNYIETVLFDNIISNRNLFLSGLLKNNNESFVLTTWFYIKNNNIFINGILTLKKPYKYVNNYNIDVDTTINYFKFKKLLKNVYLKRYYFSFSELEIYSKKLSKKKKTIVDTVCDFIRLKIYENNKMFE